MDYEIKENALIPNVVEIIRPMNEGSTRPYLCKCDDGFMYVLKSKPSMTQKNLLSELISGCLAKSIGLPLPEFKIVFVPEELVEFTPDLQRDISTGHAFASQYIEGAVALTFTQSRNETIIPIEQQKLIYLLDNVILNGDRTLTEKGGNVNILYDVSHDKYYLIDHNLSFDQDVQPDDFLWHVYSPRSRKWVYDMIDRVIYRQKVLDCTKKLPEIMGLIPTDWIVEDQFSAFVTQTLEKANQDKFWREIA